MRAVGCTAAVSRAGQSTARHARLLVGPIAALAVVAGCGGSSQPASPAPTTQPARTTVTTAAVKVPVFTVALSAVGPALDSNGSLRVVLPSPASVTTSAAAPVGGSALTPGVLTGSWRSAPVTSPGATCASVAKVGTGLDDAGKPIFSVPDVPRTIVDVQAGADGAIGGGHTFAITLFADPYGGPGSYRGNSALGEDIVRIDSTQATRAESTLTTIAGNGIVLSEAANGSGSLAAPGLSVGLSTAELSLSLRWTCAMGTSPPSV